jgi:hypothetical protein
MADEELFYSGIDLQNRGEAKRMRITKRSSAESSNATPSINSDNIDIHEITALAVALTSFTITGAPVRGQELLISIKDDGTARAITLGSNFESSGLSLPTTTTVSVKMTMRFLWNVATSKWALISISESSTGSFSPTSTNTLTNKRIQPRILSEVSNATPTFNTDDYDYYILTALAANTTFSNANVTGTPAEGEKLNIAITDNGVTRTISWGNKFQASGIPLPSSTFSFGRCDMEFVWNSVDSKWRLIKITTVPSDVTSTNVIELTNKRITKRVYSTASNTAPSIDADNYDSYILTSLAGNIATAIIFTGTPTSQQSLIVSITASGADRNLSWNSSYFESSGSAILPTLAPNAVRIDVGFIFNTATNKFRCVAVS